MHYYENNNISVEKDTVLSLISALGTLKMFEWGAHYGDEDWVDSNY